MAYQLNAKLSQMSYEEEVSHAGRVRADANESFLPLPQPLEEKIRRAIGALELNRYPDIRALDLCRAAAAVYGVEVSRLMAGNGSDELIGILIGAFLMKGEGVMVIEPDFTMYHFFAHLYENPLVRAGKRPDWTIDVDAVLETVRQARPRMLLFSNPCNPTGVGLPRAEVLRLVEGAPDTLVVVDEAYIDFWDVGQSVVDVVDRYDNLLVLRTCSKLVGLAGLRIGFAIANERLIQAMLAAKPLYNLSSVAQKIGQLVLEDSAYLDAARVMLSAATEDLGDRLRPMLENKREVGPVPPSVTNFFYLPMEDPDRVAAALLERDIVVRKLVGALRICACRPDDNERIVQALDAILR